MQNGICRPLKKISKIEKFKIELEDQKIISQNWLSIFKLWQKLFDFSII